MNKRTPTPWRVNQNRIMAEVERGNYRHYPLAYMNLDDPEHEAKGNADYIVQCVNSHDKLVEALGRIAAGEIGPNAGEVGPDLSQAYHAQGIALAALEAAQGDKP